MDPIPLSLPFLMDGATGTELQKRGMPLGACTEQWALEHPEALLELQRAYVEAGAQVLVTPTLGANRGALEKFGLADRVEEYNARLTGLTRQAAAGRALVAGDLGPTLHAIPPYGETPFEVLVGFYAEQAAALERAGVDLFLVESVMAMAEARAAVLGIRESGSRRPILVTCYCDEEGRTPSGTDVLACAIVMQGMGVTAFGLNCVDPAVAEEQLARLHLYTDLPLIAEPSAGLPDLTSGKPDYPDNADAFARRTPQWAAAGVRIFGGCCGTAPAHIAALGRAMATVDFSAFPPVEKDPDVIPCASEKEARFITPDVDVGETIQCTDHLMEDILEAEEERPVGALKIEVLDTDDLEIFAREQYAVRDALCLWSDVPELLEGALRAYQGRAFYDGTAELEPEFLARMSEKYGLILL
ncbi:MULTISPECIES: homocysteine S-methyltransferase family protein [Intestinimonas]|uniref:homocysteine S-methyltransferase family protein n=1 Tax=Intestinimonas TaxID=1392389 RepID=UPI00067E6F5E|nr:MULTISPECIES: homocysteine S-methyltransferase family protein [Intestinimonas]MBS6282741.1 homocysteine S-methyltransferase family protein [Oscillospiraceae bacterium]MDU1325633.1 homocysteine S-methyltransferase family protein [Clostridiales bacterium]